MTNQDKNFQLFLQKYTRGLSVKHFRLWNAMTRASLRLFNICLDLRPGLSQIFDLFKVKFGGELGAICVEVRGNPGKKPTDPPIST